jgi:hypothetical protein
MRDSTTMLWTQIRVLPPRVTVAAVIISCVAIAVCNIDPSFAEDKRGDFPGGRRGGGTHVIAEDCLTSIE